MGTEGAKQSKLPFGMHFFKPLPVSTGSCIFKQYIMETKKFNVQPIDDYAVVVDKEGSLQDHKPAYNKDTGEFIPRIERGYGRANLQSVIGTIGKIIEGLPHIELVDIKELEGALEGSKIYTYRDENNLLALGGFLRGYKMAQSKYKYSEEDMIQIAHDFYTKCMQSKNDMKPFDTKEWFTSYLNKPKFPKAVVLLMMKNPFSEDIYPIIQDLQTNTITPLKLIYENT